MEEGGLDEEALGAPARLAADWALLEPLGKIDAEDVAARDEGDDELANEADGAVHFDV